MPLITFMVSRLDTPQMTSYDVTATTVTYSQIQLPEVIQYTTTTVCIGHKPLFIAWQYNRPMV